MISSVENFTPLLGLNWSDELNFELRTSQIAAMTTDNQSENEVMRLLHSKYNGLIQDNQTNKGVEVKTSIKREMQSIQ